MKKLFGVSANTVLTRRLLGIVLLVIQAIVVISASFETKNTGGSIGLGKHQPYIHRDQQSQNTTT